jgi:tetratricopeptide (TPR) repeat protein
VTAFLDKYKPAWYEHVGPEDTTDPRLAYPETLLREEVPGFHDTELFRARILMAMSAKMTREIRSEAFILAAIQAGSWQPDTTGAVKLWKSLVNDQSLPNETRLKILWRAAADISQKGSTEKLAELKACDVFDSFKEDYRSKYFPMLEEQARIKGAASDKEDAAAVKRITGMELDEIGLGIVGAIHAALLTKGNEDVAKLMRNALMKWKMTPQAESKRTATRLEWARLAKISDSSLTAHRVMREAAEETLQAKAAEAPETWSARMDVQMMYDLPFDKRRAIRASRLLTGIRHDKTELFLWLQGSASWFSEGEGEAQKQSVLKALDGLREVRDDRSVWLLMLGLLEAARKWEDWTEVDKRLVFFRDAEKFPATHGFIRLWQDIRDYQPGDETDITSHLGWISLQPFKAPFYSGLLEALLLKRDKAGLERVLDEVESEQLTAPPVLSAYFEALAFLERAEELDILGNAMQTAIQDLVRDVWLTGSPFNFEQACDLAMLYGGRNALTDAFLQKAPQMMGDPHEKRMAIARVHMLGGDWKKVIATLNGIDDKDYLESADWNHLMGMALFKTGDTEKSKKHLEAACNLSRPGDMMHYHTRKLLKAEEQ